MNVIPGTARISLDVRSGSDRRRDAAFDEIVAVARAVCERRRLGFALKERQRFDAVKLDERVVETVAAAADSAGVGWTRMPSGAAHDTACIAARVPSAMVFVPCRNGVSHDPDEWVEPGDAAAGLEVVLRAALALVSG